MNRLLSRTVQLLVALLAIGLFAVPVQAQSDTLDQQNIYFFYGKGCSHCAKVEAYFEQIDAYNKYPLRSFEIYFNNQNRQLYNDILDANNVPANERGVPTLIAGSQVITGDSPIIDNFTVIADQFIANIGEPTEAPEEPIKEVTKAKISLWLIVSAAIVDAVNPCAFAVLLILLSTVLAKKSSRKKVLSSGLAFSLAIFVSYLLMGLGVYTALASAGTTNLLTTAVGILAIMLGLFNLKDFLWYGKTPPMEVPMSWRPKMAGIIEKVTSPIGALVAGLLVSLFLLPCTSGPYIVVLGLLAENPMDIHLIWYLVIYNLVFVLPMLLITLAVAFGLKVDTIAMLRDQHIDKLHLIAGLLLLGLGIFVLLSL